MKVVDMLKALSVVVCVAVASSAYAQSSDAMATTDAASAKADAKTTKKVNRKLGLDVRRALSKAQGIDVSNIFVRARGGAVTLTGSVPDGAQIPKAEEVAKGVPGVTSVTNKIGLAAPNGGGG
jgi:hyperosmotically inducible periplasmic protein